MANPLGLWKHRGYAALALVSLALTAGAFFYPVAAQFGLGVEGALVNACYSPACHQIPERTFHVFGLPLAVCERCISLYAGFTLMVLLAPFFRWNTYSLRRLLIVSIVLALPMAIDWALEAAGLFSTGWTGRMVTGFLGGAGIAYIGVPAWIEATTSHPKPTIDNYHA